MAKTWWREIVIYIAFCIVFSLNFYKHEPWRDELQAWDIARNSSDLVSLYRNLEYESQPSIWHLILFIFTKITTDPFIMRAVHAVFAFTVVYLLIFKFDLGLAEKLFIPFGYFILFEYTVISRHYILTILFGLAALALMKQGVGKNLGKITFLICFLPFSGFYGIMFALFIFAALCTSLPKKITKPAATSFSVIAITIFVGMYVLKLPTDPGRDTQIDVSYNKDRVKFSLNKLWDAYIPVFKNQVNFWNNNVYTNSFVKYRPSVLLFLVFALLFLVYKNYKSEIMYVFGTVGLLVFNYTVFNGVLRHDGHLFLILLFSYLLAKNRGPVLRVIFFVILVIQAYSGIRASLMEWKYPFATDSAVALRIKEYKNPIIVADDDARVSGVVMLLNTKAYYPKTDRWGSYIIWDRIQEDTSLDKNKTIKSAYDLKNKFPNNTVLLVTSYSIDSNLDPVVEEYSSGPSIVTSRDTHIYTLK